MFYDYPFFDENINLIDFFERTFISKFLMLKKKEDQFMVDKRYKQTFVKHSILLNINHVNILFNE